MRVRFYADIQIILGPVHHNVKFESFMSGLPLLIP